MCCRVNLDIVITECGIGFVDGPFRLYAPCEPGVEYVISLWRFVCSGFAKPI